ncbi:PTS sugar transporter subunit IIA [Hylemonella gracilis]|uniref:PTS system fructose subfamily transporter subunit IIA n=1 Tax=Hylemonella gracilis ATCC 19624 TaxID=887062 RepID=F3KQN7_9BURK|nr:PTS fructose transporter subunit IIA [Hylemonella gracilis]EGI77911.1 PTS system fructose subfamily transporter subunit IIA [Hylemonella gracilis ATCC 19624]
MNGIVIIAHAPLATALKTCAAHVFPERAQGLLALDVQADAPAERTLDLAREAVARLSDTPLLLLSDVMGATPCNVATQLLRALRAQGQGQARLLAGVNLPMLWRAVSYQHEPLDALVARALQGGSQGVRELE